MEKKEAIRHIRVAWLSGIGLGLFFIAFVLTLGKVENYPEFLSYAAVAFGVSYGVYKKNRVASILLIPMVILAGVVVVGGSTLFFSLETAEKILDHLIHLLVETLIIPFAFGIRAVFEYHKLAKKGHEFDNPVAAYNKSITLRQSGNFAEALRLCEEAIQINPKFALAWINKGSILHQVGKHKEALTCVDTAIEINPNLPAPWYIKALAQKDLGDLKGAIESLTNAIKLNNAYGEAYFERARLLAKLGELETSAQDINRSFEIDKDVFYKLAIQDELLRPILDGQSLKQGQ